MEAIWVTLITSGLATIFAIFIGLPLAALCAKNDFVCKKMLHVTLRAMYGLPPVVVGVVVYLALSKDGVLGDWGFLFTIQGMIIAQTLLILPLIWGISWTGMEEIPGEVMEIYRLSDVKIPYVWLMVFEAKNQIGAAIMLAFGRAIAEVGAVMIVGGNIKGFTRTLTTSIVLETQQGRLNEALMLGFMLLTLAMIVSIIILLFEENWFHRFYNKNTEYNEPEMEMLLDGKTRLNNVSYSIGGNEILTNISLEINQGECVVILGGSGSGKTSLLKIISGINKADGDVILNEKNMIVPQKPVYLRGNVRNNLIEKNLTIEEKNWWLNEVGLLEFSDRDPRTLSGGELQRLNVARCFASNANLMILDEFTSNLDGPNVLQMESFISEHTKRGGSVILATHNPIQAKRIGDKIFIMFDGTLVDEQHPKISSLVDGNWMG